MRTVRYGVRNLLDALAAARQLLVATFLDTFAMGAYLWRPLQALGVGMRHTEQRNVCRLGDVGPTLVFVLLRLFTRSGMSAAIVSGGLGQVFIPRPLS